jgi:AcrR family transcriptional regulator
VSPDDARPRDRLIENAVRLAARGGITHLSLRQLAAELGTSHRMLIYYFGSRDGLIAEIVRVVEEQQRAALDFLLQNDTRPDARGATVDAPDPQEQARLFWDHVVDAASTFGPLFFELTGQALQGRPHTTRLLDDLVDMWIDPLAALYVRQGVDPDQAPVHARLGLAAARGLLLDLLVTGDRAAVDAAMDLLRRMVQTEIASAEPAPGAPRAR